jgi:hypothetical protein
VSQAGLPPARFHLPKVPGPGCHPRKNTTQTGIRDVHYQGNHAGRGTNDVRHGDDQGQGHDGSTTSVAEQHHYAWRLIATAQRLTGTAAALGEAIVEGRLR